MILNKKGLTIAEAVISMVLLAVVTMGIYSVIMTSLRSSKKPEMREEMAFAIEQATARLKTGKQWDAFCRSVNPDCQGTDIDTCCSLWDACIFEEGKGVECRGVDLEGVIPDAELNTKVIANTGAHVKAKIKADRMFYGICNEEPHSYNAWDATTGAVKTVVRSPWERNTKYDISSCLLPDACLSASGSYFTYTVDNNDVITFDIKCGEDGNV